MLDDLFRSETTDLTIFGNEQHYYWKSQEEIALFHLEFPTLWVIFSITVIAAVVIIAYYIFPDIVCPNAIKGNISPDTRDPIQGACLAFTPH